MTILQPDESRAIEVMRAAGDCSDCFGDTFDLGLERAGSRVPQVRWIGPDYFNAPQRVAVVLINPGAAEGRDAAMRREEEIFRAFHQGGSYEDIRAYFKESVANRSKWLCWYRDVIGLDLNRIAHLNVAWCATRGNRYPTTMRRHCFSQHTLNLLEALAPHAVLLSGSATHAFAGEIEQRIKDVTVIPMLHYAHRGSRVREYEEAKRIRESLAEAASE